ncbi:MAG: alpha/beta hydrolase [Planctomycetaceae bacterium]
MSTTTQPSARARPTWTRRLLRLGIMLLVSYLLVVIVLGFFQRSLMYHPFREASIPPADAGLPVGRVHAVETTTADGLTLHGWLSLAEGETAADAAEAKRTLSDGRWVVLYFCGNGANRRWRADELELLNALDAHVLIFDYRGYGENDGTPSEEGLANDARAAWQFATETCGVEHGRMVIYGESMGGGVAVRLAAEQCDAHGAPGGLVLRATFSSMTDAAAIHYPWLPVRMVLLDRYPSIDRIGRVSCPVLQFHGDADRIVPIELGRRLYAAAPEKSSTGIEKRFVELPGIGHNDFLYARPDVRTALDEFFAELRSN